MSELFSYLRHLLVALPRTRRLQLAVVLSLSLFGSVFEVATVGAIMPFIGMLVAPSYLTDSPVGLWVIDLFGVNDALTLNIAITVGFVSMVLLSGAARIFQLVYTNRVVYAISADLASIVYRNVLHQQYMFHLERNSSEIITSVFAKSQQVVTNIILPVIVMINGIILSAALFAAFIFANPAVTIGMTVILVFVYGAILVVSRKALNRVGELLNRMQDLVMKNLQEGIGGVRDVILEGRQNPVAGAFESHNRPLKRAEADIQIIAAWPRFAIEAITVASIALALLFYQIGGGDILLHVPLIGAFALGAQRMLPALQQAYGSLAAIRGGTQILKEVLSLINMPSVLSKGDAARLPFAKSVEMKGVTFRYSDDSQMVFEGVDVVFSKGETIGIVGQSGKGKSTFLDIFMGLLTPIDGHMLIDGRIVRDDLVSSWQAHIAHVPQEIFLYDTTILENIHPGPAEELDEARLEKAINASGVAEFATRLEEGLYTQVGEKGSHLSGGQRQRIGIARALYNTKGVLVLDEATNALDMKMEMHVVKSIKEQYPELTVIVVTHRPKSMSSCDRVFEIQDGRLVETDIVESGK